MTSLPSAREKSKNKRTRIFTPEDRASHRLIEKQRREALNESFLELARLLPDLAQTRHISKSIIVNGSIAHLKKLRATHLAVAPEIRSLLQERDSLLAEVNAWRSQNSQAPRPRNDFDGGAIKNILNVEQEQFGTWPNGFGENGSNVNSEAEAGGENVIGFGHESQLTSACPDANGPLETENVYAQPLRFDNPLSEPDAQMGYGVCNNIPYFVGDLRSGHPENPIFTMPATIEGQDELAMAAFESHLSITPEMIVANSAFHNN